MPKKVLRALVMDDGTQLANELRELIYPVFEVGTFEIVQKAHEALEALINEEFNICLLPDSTPREDARNLMSDYRKLEKELECDFIEVRDFLPDEFDRSSLKQEGFVSVISRRITPGDIEAIEETLRHQVRAEKIIEKSRNVQESLGLMLRDLDRTAADRKRGRETPLRSISSGFIGSEASFDDKVLRKYFQALGNESASIEPPKADAIKVPENILKKKAPFLSQDRYTGVSQRVWARLVKLYGIIARPTLPPATETEKEEEIPLPPDDFSEK